MEKLGTGKMRDRLPPHRCLRRRLLQQHTTTAGEEEKEKKKDEDEDEDEDEDLLHSPRREFALRWGSNFIAGVSRTHSVGPPELTRNGTSLSYKPPPPRRAFKQRGLFFVAPGRD